MLAKYGNGRLVSAYNSIKESLSVLTAFQAALIVTLIIMLIIGSFIAFFKSRPEKIELSNTVGSESRRLTITVHIAGAVEKPGLYKMDEGSRVADALEAAGGASTDACLDGLNLASKLKDEEKITVPTSGELSDEQSVLNQGSGGLIDINNSSAEELESLPGIGESLASRIVDYRKKNGPFSSIDDLSEVEGIGPAKLESLEGLVTF